MAKKTTKNQPKKAATKATVKKLSTTNIELEKPARMLKKPEYKTLKLHKRIKAPQPKLSSAFTLTRKTLILLKQNWKLFIGITAIYAVLTLILVRGFSSSIDVEGVKEAIPEIYNGQIGLVGTTFALFGSLITSGNGATSSEGSVYQSILLVIVSLATIWGLRQVTLGNKPRIRDTFYKGLYPLVPLILVLLVIGFQLVPMAIGGWLYSVVVIGGIAGTIAEKILWLLLIFLLVLLSLYMVSSSIFSLYIVTLPDMEPLRALRSARQLALHRRWTILRKVLFLPVVLLLLAGLVMIPFLILLPFIAEWIFLFLSLFGWIITISYFYILYRELLNE